MKNSSYIIRNYHPDDFNNYFRLRFGADQLERPDAQYLRRSLLEELNRPNCSPQQNLFIAELDGKIIGFCHLTPELEIRRVIFDFMMHPLHHRKDPATMLLQHAIQRALDLDAKMAHVNISENNITAKKLLSGLGFQPVRCFFELKLHLPDADIEERSLGTFKSRSLKAGEEEMLTQIQNRFFKGSWGFNPNTREEVYYRLHLSDCSPERVILLCKEDNPVGYCWTTVNPEENLARGVKKARIHMMGVDPEYRKKGLGKEVLTVGLSYLKEQGIEIVELTVDSENKAALALYESAGFEIFAVTRWYEKMLT
ncbi:MAG: GNAT family N-acetyltransferase [Deltaproteobacteria bacterium]|nr:GNAT family N-acetyltransferase [Deltaproteobacteria bacterium]